MRYRWDAGAVEVDGEEVARTGARFWSESPEVEVLGEDWAFQHGPSGLAAARDGEVAIALERGGLLASRWRMEGPSGATELVRTTNWLLGALCLDLEQRGMRIGSVAPAGPWRYRPELELEAGLTHAEAVFVLWAAYRMEMRRPGTRIAMSGYGGGASGAAG